MAQFRIREATLDATGARINRDADNQPHFEIGNKEWFMFDCVNGTDEAGAASVYQGSGAPLKFQPRGVPVVKFVRASGLLGGAWLDLDGLAWTQDAATGELELTSTSVNTVDAYEQLAVEVIGVGQDA